MNYSLDCNEAKHNNGVLNDRRRLLQFASGGVFTGLFLNLNLAHAASKVLRAAPGDLLVSDDVEGNLLPLKAADIEAGKPILAYPFDPLTNTARSDSRLNKVLLIRLLDHELNSEAKSLSVEGIFAFSAVCTHQGCEVKTWLSKEKALACYCHGSKFSPTQAGAVVGGPAPRALPVLPLALRDGVLVVAGEFSSPPGAPAGGG